MSERPLVLVFYTRPGCHLCDVAKESIQPLLRRYSVRLVERDVQADPAWESAFGQEIPVGVIEGRKIFKYRADLGRLERAILARRRAAR